jgi:adenylylsulfate kinase
MTPGRVIWFTGLPAAGKSTLAGRVAARLRKEGVPCAVLDGDEVREALARAPGAGAAERDAFYEALARLAALLARQGLCVLVAATAPRRAHRERARALAPAFAEVLVATSAEACAARDPKGLWRRARSGELRELPGAGAEYEPPASPELVAEGGEDPVALEALIRGLRAGNLGLRGADASPGSV